ncbi:MAG: amidohydrolase family protein [Bacteroidota bacterium]
MKTRLYIVIVSLYFCAVNYLFAQKPDTTYYSVVKGGAISGIQKTWRGNNEIHFFYSYNDRGRGDSLYEDIQTDAQGMILKSATYGVDYFKKPYHASFEVKGDSATAVTNEDVKAKLYKNEFYAGTQAPGSIELMMKAASSFPGNKIPLFAGDTFEVRMLHEMVVGTKDRPLSLLLAETYFGINFPPVFFWLDKDMNFFASVSEWFSTIQQGYESLNAALLEIQEKQALSYYTQQMLSLSEKIPEIFAINHVRVYDSENAKMMNDMTVVITDGKVTRLGSTAGILIPESTTVIDGNGKTLLPGLWDMHGHYAKEEGLFYLAGGVTHIRDMGNGNSILVTKDALRKNQMLGPDINYLSGFIDKAGPFQGPTGAIIHSLDEGISAVDEYAKNGYSQIKLYSSIEPSWVKPLAEEAHAKGMRVAGHIPSFMTAAQAVKDGYDEITHMNMVMLNFLGDTIDTRTPRRFSMVGDYAKNIDVNGKEANEFIQLLKQKKTTLDPTMNVFNGMFRVFPGDTDAAYKPIIGWMPADQRENIRVSSGFGSEAQRSNYTASFKNMLKMLKRLYDEGILIVSGTDGGEAIALEHELELYIEAGIPPLKTLQTATWNAAKDCKLQGSYGSIAVGREADMILVDGNPGQNISDIRRVEWVIKNNYRYSPKKLYGSIGWTYYY